MEKAKILIVEDHSDFALMNSFALKKAGYLTATALSGAEALVQIESFRPNVILMDLTLPDFEAGDFLARVRSLDYLKDTPIILASGREEIKQRCEELGCHSYLRKPFGFPQLLEAVAKALNDATK